MRERELLMIDHKVVSQNEFNFGVGFIKSKYELKLFYLLIGRDILTLT